MYQRINKQINEKHGCSKQGNIGKYIVFFDWFYQESQVKEKYDQHNCNYDIIEQWFKCHCLTHVHM